MKYEAALDLRGVCIAAGLAFLFSAADAEQRETSRLVDVDGATATVIANDVPLRQVLEELALRSGIIVYSRAPLDATVTLAIEDESVPGVIRRILKQYSFTLHYVSDSATGLPLFGSRLWIFADDAAATAPLWAIGEPADEWTFKYAAGDPERKRIRAISNIVTWEDDAGMRPELLAAMNDPYVAVREEAVHVMGELDEPETLSHLKNALHDPARRVRIAAIEALAESGGDSAAVVLAELLNDEDSSIRAEVIHALADVGGDVAHHYLQQALADASEINRETAAAYLSEFASLAPANRF